MSGTAGLLAAVRSAWVGDLADGVLQLSTSVEDVWQHIRTGLEAIAEPGVQPPLPENEAGLTTRLITELERRRGDRPYFFQKEFPEDEYSGSSPRTDLSVQARDAAVILVKGVSFSGSQPFLTVEAKRLPTPGAGREREYVAGSGGGIERFKRKIHGRSSLEVGMIAYVQESGFEHWHQTINGWVDELSIQVSTDLTWTEEDRLQFEDLSSRTAVLRSSNLRAVDGVVLEMRHLWVDLTVR